MITNPSLWDTGTGNIDFDITVEYSSTTTTFNDLYVKTLVPTTSAQEHFVVGAIFCRTAVSLLLGSSASLQLDETALDVNLASYFSEDNSDTNLTSCHGHEYIISNLVVNSG